MHGQKNLWNATNFISVHMNFVLKMFRFALKHADFCTFSLLNLKKNLQQHCYSQTGENEGHIFVFSFSARGD